MDRRLEGLEGRREIVLDRSGLLEAADVAFAEVIASRIAPFGTMSSVSGSGIGSRWLSTRSATASSCSSAMSTGITAGRSGTDRSVTDSRPLSSNDGGSSQ
ncbi:hypothetical protein [Salinadaptatus halalkaliphilus]|uniref:hypothetical protein n=1 Tax=Salinadaptatus halalkaliphilus TaxID=2419781 RepID=UPI001142F8C4|nr:hypothetical protein [Salinadaptatus halalkaliphilus]